MVEWADIGGEGIAGWRKNNFGIKPGWVSDKEHCKNDAGGEKENRSDPASFVAPSNITKQSNVDKNSAKEGGVDERSHKIF